MKFLHLIFLLYLFVLPACNGSVESSTTNGHKNQPVNDSNDWLIPKDEIEDGGPGKDGIPSVDNPKFAEAQNTNYIDESRLVTGIKIDGAIKAYPHQVMDYHEIVNDQIGDVYFALTYCPLTGTAIAWKRNADLEYGVSGLLFRNNLIPYDRNTDSRYSQMQMRAVNGPRSGFMLTTIPVIQTSWTTWKSIYPHSQVLTTKTGYNRNYNQDLYGKEYRDKDSAPLFPITNIDHRLPTKERVHGIIWGKLANEKANVRTYEIDKFGNGIHLIHDNFAGGPITIIGSSDKNFAVSFFNTLEDGAVLQFKAIQDSLPVIMKDQEGNYWDIFGYAIQGPRKGSRLKATNSYTGYWFAWADFFPDLEIYRF